MTITQETTIRSVGLTDLPLLVAAQKASSHELDALSTIEIAEALAYGKIQGLVLEADDRRMIVTWQRDGHHALLTCFYREGAPTHFLSDCKRLLERTEGMLREFGVRNVFAGVGYQNPQFERLIRLYGRLGFGPDMLRVGKTI